MNRRQFLKSLFVAGIATAINIDAAIERTLIDTVNLTDNEFIAYIKFSMNMWVTNPRSCMIINNMGEPEEWKQHTNLKFGIRSLKNISFPGGEGI